MPFAIFRPTHPMRGATPRSFGSLINIFISTHTPHAGCDCLRKLPIRHFKRFQLTHPMRVRLPAPFPASQGSRHFNSHTPCGVRHRNRTVRRAEGYFNSHTPCGVRPDCQHLLLACRSNFNSHTPCGVRLWRQIRSSRLFRFQLTHPMRGATSWYPWHRYNRVYFNSHTPCGVRLATFDGKAALEDFNSHTPCGVRHVLALLTTSS